MNATTHTIFVAPAAPLVLRSGKAFGTVGAAGGDALAFPLPGSLAGALRGALGDARGVDFINDFAAVNKLKEIQVRGPLFASISPYGHLKHMLPRPLDAMYLQEDDAPLNQLSPGAVGTDEYSDLPDGLVPLFLQSGPTKSKPAEGPAFWDWERLIDWLIDPAQMCGRKMQGERRSRSLTSLGTGLPPTDVRTHVVIDEESQHGIDGGLFQSAGADFGPRQVGTRNRGWEPSRYGVIAALSEPLGPGYIKFGGEGRLARVEAVNSGWPDVPNDLLAALKNKKKLRMLFATPGLFKNGWKPDWLQHGGPPSCEAFALQLKAAAVERAQPVSGWDMTQREKGQKPARRMVPAGAVYWFEIGAADPALDAAALANKLWLMPAADEERDCRDGYGLALFGTWD